MADLIFFNNQKEFNDWLEVYYLDISEVWIGYMKKSAGHNSLTWSDSVDVALCFGWIDGIRKTIDSESYKIRFTPRKTNSVWSAVNVKKVQSLIAQGKMKPEGLQLFNERTDIKGYTSEDRNIPLDKKYEKEIKSNLSAWSFFDSLAPSYKKQSIWWVMSAKREETRLKRLDILISSSQAGLKIPSLRKK